MSAVVRVRKAKVTDAQDIRALEREVWKEEVVNKYDIPMFVRFGYVFVACAGKKIVGAIVSYRTKDDDVYVCDVVVKSSHRGQHIAEKLYQTLLREVRGKDVVSFLDPKNVPTLKLHEKLGAKTDARVKNAYNLNRGIEAGTRLLIRIKN